MSDLWLPRASTYAGDIDFLIILVTVLVGVWFIAAEALLFWLCFKYRAAAAPRAGHVTGEEQEYKKPLKIAHVAMLAFDLVIIFFAIRVWYDVKQDLKPADETVRIVAQQWAWTFTQPGPDGKLDTADDIVTVNELHLRSGTTYQYELMSADVLHSLSIPAFRLKHDAIPGRTIKGWFTTIAEGEHDLQCAEICGIGHALMPARVHIESAAAHAEWMSSGSHRWAMAR